MLNFVFWPRRAPWRSKRYCCAAVFEGLPECIRRQQLWWYRHAPIAGPCRSTLRELDRMGVECVELDVRSPYPSFGPSFKILAAAHISQRSGPPFVVQIDSDTLFLGEPDLTLEGFDIAARPVDLKGMCTTGEADPFDEFWHNLCRICEVGYNRLPVLETTVDRKAVRASYNGG